MYKTKLYFSVAAALLININARASDVIVPPTSGDYLYNAGDINGSLIVPQGTTVTGFVAFSSNGGTVNNISGNMVNNGTVGGSFSNGYGTGTPGSITGSLINASSGIVDALINGTDSTVGGDVVNQGTVQHQIANLGNIAGSLVNVGTFGSPGAFSITENGGTVSGDMINSGSGYGSIENVGTIYGNFINAGILTSDPAVDNRNLGTMMNRGTVADSMINKTGGNIFGTMLNDTTGTVGGSMVNDGQIGTDGDLAGDMVNRGGITGAMVNAGTIGTVSSSAISGMYNSGTIGLDMQNAGQITGAMDNNGTITGSMINAGTVDEDAFSFNFDGGSMSNEGTIGGSMVNAAGAVVKGEMVNDSQGNITGDLMNAGQIVSESENSGTFQNSGAVKGSMINAGVVGSLSSLQTSGMYNAGSVGGDMRSSGTVNGAMDNNGTVAGSMVNAGKIDGDPISERLDSGSMSNRGTVGGSMVNAAGAAITGEMHNDSGAVISGDMVNAGTITADPGEITAGRASGNLVNDGTVSGKIINTGTIYGGIANTGTVTGGIFNSGNVVGSVTLGDASLTLAGTDASIVGIISGSGASALYVGDADHSADYTAASGNNAVTGTLAVAENSRLTLGDGVQWTAQSTAADAISNAGTLVLGNQSALNGNLTSGGTLTLSGASAVSASVNGSLVNNGTIVLNPTPVSAGNTLTVSGDYTGGANSSVSLGAVLGGDNSLTDKLVIRGNSSGASTLYVANENGAGAQTLEGIQLVEVDGTSSAVFTQGNRVVAGAYDYFLQKGDAGGNDAGSWYLTSRNRFAVRPEAGSYTANLQAANSMFAMSLHDREGEKSYSGDSGGMWLRQVGGRNKTTMSDGQNKTSANRYIVQLGGTLWKTATGEKGSLDTGVMGGYASQRSHTRNSLTGYRSTGFVDGYSVGIYATWYQDAKEKSGFYVDSWLQYAWFNNEVKGDDLAPETYNSRGLTASAESGYNWQAGKWTTAAGMENTVWLQPHAQVIWSGIRADDHTESNGTRVTASGEDNVQLRTGLRAYIKGKSALDRNTGREFQPFVEANWIYNTRQYGTSLNSDNDSLRGTRNAGEIKAGIEAHVSRGLSVWTDVAQVMGGSGYNDTQGTLGLRYSFR